MPGMFAWESRLNASPIVHQEAILVYAAACLQSLTEPSLNERFLVSSFLGETGSEGFEQKEHEVLVIPNGCEKSFFNKRL